MATPTLIQGGMGVGVSGWRLARAVARTGQLGVVSGTALPSSLPASCNSATRMAT